MAVQTGSSSLASALECCQIPMSRQWPFLDRAKSWPRAQSPSGKPEPEAGLPRVHGFLLSPRPLGRLGIPSWRVSRHQGRRLS